MWWCASVRECNAAGLGEAGPGPHAVVTSGGAHLCASCRLGRAFEPSRAESSRVEPSRVESSRVESSRGEARRGEASRGEPGGLRSHGTAVSRHT